MPVLLVIRRVAPRPVTPPLTIPSAEFHALMAPAPAVRQAEDLYWVHHGDGSPWFTAEWLSDGTIVLATSEVNHRFLRNLPDLLDQGLRMAGQLRAQLFEYPEGHEVVAAGLAARLQPGGPFLAHHLARWKQAMERLGDDLLAPLDFPIGPVDTVPEFLLFHLIPAKAIPIEAARAAVEQALPGSKAEVLGSDALIVSGPEEGALLAKVLLRPDGEWLIWPIHGLVPFARVAPAVVATAEAIAAEVGGEFWYAERPYETVKQAIHERMRGPSAAFYAWTRELSGEARKPGLILKFEQALMPTCEPQGRARAVQLETLVSPAQPISRLRGLHEQLVGVAQQSSPSSRSQDAVGPEV
jgi:hypothetical protein